MKVSRSLFFPTLAFSLLLLSGCAETIDATNEATLEASIEKMTAKLSQQEVRQFQQGMQRLVEENVGELSLQDMMNPEAVARFEDRLLKTLDGKTAKQILAAGK